MLRMPRAINCNTSSSRCVSSDCAVIRLSNVRTCDWQRQDKRNTLAWRSASRRPPFSGHLLWRAGLLAARGDLSPVAAAGGCQRGSVVHDPIDSGSRNTSDQRANARFIVTTGLRRCVALTDEPEQQAGGGTHRPLDAPLSRRQHSGLQLSNAGTHRPAAGHQRTSSLSDLGPDFIMGLVELRG